MKAILLAAALAAVAGCVSAADAQQYVPSEDFDTLNATGNNDPRGIWSDGTTMWVADDGDDKIYAYRMPADPLVNPSVDPGARKMIEHAPRPTPRDNDDTNEPIELYTLEVIYRTYHPNTSCSLSFDKAGSSGLSLDTGSTLTFGATVKDSKNMLKSFEDVVDCGGNPVEVTGVATAIVDEWNDGISQFAKLYLTVEDGINDDKPDATFTFDSQGRAELSEGDYPSFGNSDLKVHGTLPTAEGLLISIEYMSASANVCEKATPTS